MPNPTRRGYHLIWLWCYHCQQERPFNRIERWKSPQPRVVHHKEGKTITVMSTNITPGVAPDARLIRGYCMVCNESAMYVITDSLWEASAYTLDFLCACGLPWDHECKHLIDLELLHAS